MGARLMRRMGWKEGRGLGKGEVGSVACVRAKRKRDAAGIGAAAAGADASPAFAAANTAAFNQLLARLQREGGGGAASAAAADVGVSPVVRTAAAARRPLWSKARRSKDLRLYSQQQMREVLGCSAAGSAETETAPATADAAPPAAAVALLSSAEPPSSPSPARSPLVTVTSRLSMVDYFRLRAEQAAASQSSSCSSSKKRAEVGLTGDGGGLAAGHATLPAGGAQSSGGKRGSAAAAAADRGCLETAKQSDLR